MAQEKLSAPPRVVLMGVAGCGKTTVGRALAERVNGRFLDGDDLHPPENVEKMRSGQPLDDADRAPWLTSIAEALQNHKGPESLIVACSALKKGYRRTLRASPVRFVYLRGSRDVISRRLAGRRGHFMPKDMLDSQFSALEEPADADVIDIDGPVEGIVDRIVKAVF